MDQEELFKRLAVALAAGLLIGLERGWKSRDEAEGERAAGLRTHALSGLLGGVVGALTAVTGAATLGLAFLAFAALTGVFHVMEARAERKVGATGAVAGLLAFMLGAFAVLGEPRVAAAGAVAATGLLALKQPLHGWLRRIDDAELRAALVLLAMTFLLLPILPHRPLDPWGALDPARIWWYAILISGISFAGYIAIKLVGDKGGVTLAALFGGLASSTATTVTFAGMARDNPASSGLLAGGAMLAGAVMAARVWVIAVIVNQALAPVLAWPLGAATLVQGAIAALLTRGAGQSEQPPLRLANPFELSTAIKLAALIGAINLAAKLVADYVGDRGLLALAAVSGLADVDAITLSFSKMAAGQISMTLAAAGIGIAVAVNTLTKAGIAWSIAGPAMGWRMTATGLAAIAAGALAWRFGAGG